MRGPLVVVGDVLLDRDLSGRADRLSPDAPVPVVSALTEAERPGGAGLAALLAARDAGEVVLVTALGDDPAGERVAALLAAAGVTVIAGRLPGRTPVKERIRVAGQSLLRLDREEAAPGPPVVTAAMRAAVHGAGALLVSDYGRGLSADARLRSALAAATASVPVVWDPHPRGAEPVPGVRVATPNLAEALRFTGLSADGGTVAAAARAARLLARRWRAAGVAVTLGPRGALLAGPDDVPLAVPVSQAAGGDPCGAGDRFAATVTVRLAAGALPSEAVTAGVAAASAYVAAGGPASLAPVLSAPSGSPSAAPGGSVASAAGSALSMVDPGLAVPDRPGPVGVGRSGTAAVSRPAAEVVRRTRAAGGVVVATGGCFDLLHAGHVATLEAARRLGDCLVVCLNSDESVRRLKGAGRPLVPARDRVRVLEALGAVDAVTVFAEDTPLAVLDAIRPDVWVKGGDYAAPALPETELLAGWDGQVVVVPYLAGRSTTRLVETAGGELSGNDEMTTAGRQDG
ncbi:MAG TPA: PfkB family carbohydrate kinase [Mycobacteriales bacterium]|nr:PfkB family carbohydrate kinase [Mycobacteriales bacterium]